MGHWAQPIAGVAVIVIVAYATSAQRSSIAWRIVGRLLVTEALMIAAVQNSIWAERVLGAISRGVLGVERASAVGARFVFGHLVDGPRPYSVADESVLGIFAFQVFPAIIVFSALVSLGWHWRVLPWAVRLIGFGLAPLAGGSRACAAACGSAIVLSMVEIQLWIRSHLASMSRADVFALMVCGLATSSGTVLVAYQVVLSGVVENAGALALVASLFNVFSALVLARISMPVESESSPGEPQEGLPSGTPSMHASAIVALNEGIGLGVRVSVVVGSTLIAYLAFASLVDGIWTALTGLSLDETLGRVFFPAAWLLGFDAEASPLVAAMIGKKLVLNEMIAMLDLASVGPRLGAEGVLVAFFALCGFANLGSVGILIGTFTVLASDRMKSMGYLPFRALGIAMLANLLTGALYSMVVLVWTGASP